MKTKEGMSIAATLWARARVAILTSTVAAVDLSPPMVRFGLGRAIRNRLLAASLPVVTSSPEDAPSQATPTESPPSDHTILLVTRSLGTGGVEAVVASLARELPRLGVAVEVLCESPGPTADSMRRDGVKVTVAPDAEAAETYLRTLPSDSIAELHNAPDYLVDACRDAGIVVVPVIHTTDINLSPERWNHEAGMTELVPVSIAVSETVRAFYLHHLPRPAASPVVVVHNGATGMSATRGDRGEARRALSSAAGVDLDRAIVLLCLARYELQKNIPGLVASFLTAARQRTDLHLVIAGPVEDWLEHALAKSLLMTHPAGDRVHLLGTSSPRQLIAASDGFILDSFFEGWPISATEAVLAGIPILLPMVGGALELAGPDGARGLIFDNPAGPPETIGLAEIRRARRRPGRQRNQMQLAEAVLTICADMDSWRERRASLAESAREWLSAASMAAAHAELLKNSASRDDLR